MRKIAVVTGTRAEYGYLKPLMEEIKKDTNLELIPIVTGMHLMPEYGYSYKIIKKDFSESVKISMQLEGDSPKDMANYLSNGIKNLSEYFNKILPDIVVGLGDRSEALAAALASLYLNIVFAHINGGDVSGTTIDESIRHAITKIAHIHLAHTKQNAKRIEKMGEERKRIFITGALTLDTILKTKSKSKNELFKKYKLEPNKTTFLVSQHPITTLKDRGLSQIKELFLALDELKNQTIIIYPNIDAGSKQFIDLIKIYERKKFIYSFKNLTHEDYLGFMKYADLMIGNSSSGIIEGPSFKIPVINIGSRQQGRERSENIIDIKPIKNEILKAINFSLTNKNFRAKLNNCKNKFGDGKASKRITKILKEIKIDEKIIQKQITY